MELNDRLTWLLVGAIIGFILGYITRSIASANSDYQIGSINLEMIERFSLGVVVVVTFWAAWQSQLAVNRVHDTQHDQSRVVSCTQHVLETALNALNSRTERLKDPPTANLELQKAESDLLQILFHKPPLDSATQEAAEKQYLTALGNFIRSTEATLINTSLVKYPQADDLVDCIDGSSP